MALTYDCDIQSASRVCQGTCSQKISSDSAQPLISLCQWKKRCDNAENNTAVAFKDSNNTKIHRHREC